jgi:hypothetical protein
VTAPRGCKPKPGITVHRTRLIHPDDRTTVDGIPVTSVARTIVDLADVQSDRLLAAAVNEAEVRRVFDLTAIEETRSRLPGRNGGPRLARVLAAYTQPPGYKANKAERLFLRLCDEHGLPTPQRIAVAGYELGIQVARVPWRDLTEGELELVAELEAIRARRCAALTRVAQSPSVAP